MRLIEPLYFLISFDELNLIEIEKTMNFCRLWFEILWNTSKIHDDMLTVLLGFGAIIDCHSICSQKSVLIMFIHWYKNKKSDFYFFIILQMDVKIDLAKYAKKLAKIVIDKSIMEDKIFDVIISDEDKAKVFFLISEKLRETAEEYLSLIKKRKWKN